MYGVQIGVTQAHDFSAPTLTGLKALCTKGQSVILHSVLGSSKLKFPYGKYKYMTVLAPSGFGHVKPLIYCKIPMSWNSRKLFQLQNLYSSVLSEIEIPF